MEDLFATDFAPVLVECRPFYDFGLERVIGFGYEFPSQRLEDGRGVDTMREKVVEHGADLEETSWTALFDDLVGDLTDESLPIWRWNNCCICDCFTAHVSCGSIREKNSERVLLCVNSLEHEQSLPQIPSTLLCDPLVEAVILLPAFLLPNNLQCRTNILLRRRCNPH